jgi:hypothetical protein
MLASAARVARPGTSRQVRDVHDGRVVFVALGFDARAQICGGERGLPVKGLYWAVEARVILFGASRRGR